MKSKKAKLKKTNKKSLKTYLPTKKEISRLKSLYKKGGLKFDAKEIAKSILEDSYFKRGLSK